MVYERDGSNALLLLVRTWIWKRKRCAFPQGQISGGRMCTQSMLHIRPRSSAHLAPAPSRLDALPEILEGVTDRMLRNMALEYEGDGW